MDLIGDRGVIVGRLFTSRIEHTTSAATESCPSSIAAGLPGPTQREASASKCRFGLLASLASGAALAREVGALVEHGRGLMAKGDLEMAAHVA